MTASSFVATNESLWRFATMLNIAHHIPGRVRLKVAAGAEAGLAAAVDEAKSFVRAVERVPGIRSINLNLLARSCVVEYDPSQIAPMAWGDLVSGNRTEATVQLLSAIYAASNS